MLGSTDEPAQSHGSGSPFHSLTYHRSWKRAPQGWRTLFAGMSADDLGSTVAYRNSQGERFERSLHDVLDHVANHGTHHRGQIVLLLRIGDEGRTRLAVSCALMGNGHGGDAPGRGQVLAVHEGDRALGRRLAVH